MLFISVKKIQVSQRQLHHQDHMYLKLTENPDYEVLLAYLCQQRHSMTSLIYAVAGIELITSSIPRNCLFG